MTAPAPTPADDLADRFAELMAAVLERLARESAQRPAA